VALTAELGDRAYQAGVRVVSPAPGPAVRPSPNPPVLTDAQRARLERLRERVRPSAPRLAEGPEVIPRTAVTPVEAARALAPPASSSAEFSPFDMVVLGTGLGAVPPLRRGGAYPAGLVRLLRPLLRRGLPRRRAKRPRGHRPFRLHWGWRTVSHARGRGLHPTRLAPDRSLHQLLERPVQLQDQVDRTRSGERADEPRHNNGGIGRCEEAKADEENGEPVSS
jgi:hypothetical protein